MGQPQYHPPPPPPPPSLFNPNLYYQFESILAPGKVLAASLNNQEGQKYKMIIENRNNGQNQKFKILMICPGRYQMIATIHGANFTIEVPKFSKEKKERILISQVNNQDNQYWQFVSKGDKDIYQVKSFCGYVLDVLNSETSNDTPVVQEESKGGQNQKWKVKPKLQNFFNPNLDYQFETVFGSGRLLSASLDNREGEKYKMIIEQRRNAQNQKFKVVQSSPGKYQIISSISGSKFTVQVPNGSTQAGERILISQINNQENQYWEFIPVSEGVYSIKSFFGLVLDVYGSKDEDGSPVFQYSSNGGQNQQWKVKTLQQKFFNPNLYYQLESVLAPGLVLDASLSPIEAERFKMIIYKRHGGQNQRFRIVQVKPGKYQMITTIKGGNYSMQVPNGSIKKQQRILVNPVHNQDNQYWQFIPVSEGVYTIKSFSGLVLDVYYGKTQSGTPVVQQQSSGGSNQQWKLTPKQQSLFDPNLYYQFESILAPGKVLAASLNNKQGEKYKMIIENRNNGENQKCKVIEVGAGKYQLMACIQDAKYTVQVPNLSTQVGERILVSQVNNHENQFWEFLPTGGNGVYIIKSFCNLVLDVYYSKTDNGTPVMQQKNNGGQNQQWRVRPK